MNYLAHLTLSHFSPALQVGNFLADHIKGRRMLEALPADVRLGVAMHRDIDRRTDADPSVMELNRILKPRHGRYAGVITDVALDHALYRAWDSMGVGEYDAFSNRCYARLRAARPHLPPKPAHVITAMTDGRWLRMYTSKEGMQHVFDRMRPRMSRPEHMDGVMETLRTYEADYNRVLRGLFNSLRALTATYRAF